MTHDVLNHFARHLQSCFQQEFARRPGPFRQVELSPVLLDADDTPAPLLVFWVNRESFFAGAILQFPMNTPGRPGACESHRARALGLTDYYTWGSDGIALWRDTAEQTTPLWALPVSAEVLAAPEDCHAIVHRLLEEMHQRFFTAQAALPCLSPLYLANLLHAAYGQLLPALLAVNPSTGDRKDQVINPLLRRFAQLTTLAWNGRLPTAVTPENLPAALTDAVHHLNTPQTVKQTSQDESLLFQGEATRLLHNLTLRLHQFGPDLRPHLATALEKLFPVWARQLGAEPLPPAIASDTPLLLINPDVYQADPYIAVEVAPPGLLAAAAAIRQLRTDTSAPQQHSDPLTLTPPLPIRRVTGSLIETRRPATGEAHELNARLRLSWPNRNLSFLASTPMWVWHLVHLIGTVPVATRFDLHLPADWLSAPHGERVYALLTERFVLRRITIRTDGLHHVAFASEEDQAPIEVIAAEGIHRTIEPGDDSLSLARLRLALLLPEPLMQLFECGDLALLEANAPPPSPAAIALFLRSTPGRTLWRLLQSKTALPTADRAATECIRHGIPLPRQEMLQALSSLARQKPPVTRATIDRDVTDWLGSDSMVHVKSVRTTTVDIPPEPADDAAIVIAASRDGILRFPEDFLYAVPQSERSKFPACAPLTIVETFFEVTTLATSEGDRLQVSDPATASALLLATSIGKRAIELPQPGKPTIDMLQRYSAHLHQLREALAKEAAAQNTAAVAATVDRIWKTLPVPPWTLVREHLPPNTQEML
jgi:hypothetical protein